MKKQLIAVVLALSFMASGAARTEGTNAFSFVALGDLPYGAAEKAYAPYRALIDRINQSAPAFSIHIGDIKSGSTACSDQEFANQLAHFQRFHGPVVYTPGDNDWTDCHRLDNGAYDPIERLATLRKQFFPPGRSLGHTAMPVENQPAAMHAHAQFVENQRWVREGVVFATLHIVGSNNNLEGRDPAAMQEFFARDAANVAWIQDTFDWAQKNAARAVVFAFQADVFDTKSAFEDFPGWSGFRRTVGQTLLPLAKQWGKPVLVVHGDSHHFRFDQPFSIDKNRLSNVTRLIVPGASDVRAVRVLVTSEANFQFELLAP